MTRRRKPKKASTLTSGYGLIDVDQAELAREIITGANPHNPCIRLVGSWAFHRESMLDAKCELESLFDGARPR